jgi:histidyl-tRNA synthetase
MAKPKSGKPQKLKARLPRGLADRSAGEIAATRHMVEAIRVVFERYGFEPVETPAIEYTDALGKFLPDQDRPNEGVFSFKDEDEQWLSLRYDLTAPLARYVAENYQNLALPYRSYRYGWVFRNEKPGPGRFRQFMQFDADTVGAPTMAADAEMCMLAADTMEALGIERGQYVVRANNRKLLDGLLEGIDLKGDANAARRLTVLRAIDKIDRLKLSGIRELLGKGRWDGGEEGKGDFTKGAELNEEQQIAVVDFFTTSANVRQVYPTPTYYKDKDTYLVQDYKAYLNMLDLPRGLNPTSSAGIEELRALANIVENAGYRDRIELSTSVVRGLEYYTGPVFEVELLIETKDDKDRPIRFGSVGGGGRYDGLVSRFMGQPVPATGFSIGVSRLQAALTALGELGEKAPAGPVLVTVFGAESVTAGQTFATRLRNAGIRAELYLGNPKHGIGQQLKYADKRGSPCAVIQGPDEKTKGEVQIRDLIAGSAPSDIKERDAYLKQQAQAQFAVKEADLVEAVRKLLKRHGL